MDAKGIPLSTLTAPANRHDDSPLLPETLHTVAQTLGGLPEGTNVHLDRAYDSKATRERLKERGLLGEISKRGKPAPFWASNRWWSGRVRGTTPTRSLYGARSGWGG